MALILKHLLDHVQGTLGGGTLPGNLDKVGILNQAGEHLHSMHPWKWAQGRTTLLSLRGTITGTAATWTASTLTLTLSAAFTNYTFVSGDEINITSGSGTEGFYTVASRTSANAIVLTSSLSASNQTDIAFTLQPYSIDLPDDTREIIALRGTGATRYAVTLTSLTEVLRAREGSGTNDAHWYGAISYVGSPPTPILEISPGSGSNVTGALRMFYRARWARLTGDTVAVEVPEFMEALLVQIVRAFARGYVREDQASLSMRLAEIQAGPLFTAAVKSDGAIQPYYGTTRNGIDRWRHHGPASGWVETTSRIQGPS